MLHLNRLAYTVQPIPVVGGVDLASVFLNRVKFASEGLYFSKFELQSFASFAFICTVN
jgi:hypothetical protein